MQNISGELYLTMLGSKQAVLQVIHQNPRRRLCHSKLHYMIDYTLLKQVLCFLYISVSRLEKVDWRVDYILSSSELKEVNDPSVQLRLHVKNPDTGAVEPTSFAMSADKFRVFLSGKLRVGTWGVHVS